jgi:nickel superoxide dismutase
MKTILRASIVICLLFTAVLHGHCEIPCGIYGDPLRFELIREHVQTIEKSMQEINRLSKHKNPDYNQLIRWVNNKELHAQMLQEIVSQYFLHQRVIPLTETNKEYQSYLKKLELLHGILVSAMKCKQGTDPAEAACILYYLDAFEEIYFDEHGHKH